MTEQAPGESSAEQRINDVELARLGALLVEASMRPDLDAVAQEHVARSTVERPNTVGESGFFVGGDVPMSDNNVYRQVGVEAVEDVAGSGVVRNGATARGEEHPRWGHRVFWHPGESQKKMPTGGRMVIEADKAAALTDWITANNIKGVYAKDSDGVTKNIFS